MTGENFPENEYDQNQYGWKIHLNVPQNPENPLVRDIAAFCRANKISYKIGVNSGQEGKGMTLRIGSYDKMMKIAETLEQQFGQRLSAPAGDALADDQLVTHTVAAKFDARRSADFTQYGKFGIPFHNDDAGPWNADIPLEVKLRNATRLLSAQYGAYFHGADPTWLQSMQKRGATVSRT